MTAKKASTSGAKKSTISDLWSGANKIKTVVGYHSLEKDMWRATQYGGDKNLRDNIGALQAVAKKNFKYIRHGRVDRKMKMEMLKEVMADAKKQGHNFTGEDRREVLGVIDAMANYHKNRKAYNKERALERVKKEDIAARDAEERATKKGAAATVGGGNLMDGSASNRDVAGSARVDSAGGGGIFPAGHSSVFKGGRKNSNINSPAAGSAGVDSAGGSSGDSAGGHMFGTGGKNSSTR